MINLSPYTRIFGALALTSALLLPSLPASAKTTASLDAQGVKQAIQQNLEDNLYQLPPRVQGHYGIRLYRMTGDDKYANAALDRKSVV